MNPAPAAPELALDAPAPSGHACHACGAPVETLDSFCQACGAPQEQNAATGDVAASRHFRCQACGAETGAPAEARSFICPFCDSNYVLELPEAQTHRQSPEFVIGFSVTPELALARFREWIGRRHWFRPGDLAVSRVEEKLRGVYLPFWTFSMLAESRWSASIGEYWYRTETYTTVENGKTVTKTRQVQETEWWSLSGQHHEFYSGYLVSGSKGLAQAQAERIKPFQLAGLKRYRPAFLAGWLSEEYSVEREEALVLCQQEFRRQEEAAIAAFLPGDTHSSLGVQTQFSRINSDLALLPVYLLSYRYGERIYRFMVNGQSGKFAGDKPLSKRRIAVAVGLALAAALVVGLLIWWRSR